MAAKRSSSIADALESLILTGQFADGERLDEVQLADRFQVSRTPLREAIQKLAATGLVEQRPHRGAFVRQPGPVELLEMFEYMAELEASCARLAAPRITDDAIAALNAINARSHAAVEARDADAYYAENETFHATIYRQSGNTLLEADCLRLQRRLSPFRRRQLRLRGRLGQSMGEHEAIVAALAKGDAAGAAETMRNHVAVQGEKFQNLIALMREAAE